MKALVVCNVYSALLVALQVKRYYMPDDQVDIILTDYSNDMDRIAKNLQETGLFHRVYFAPVKKVYAGGNIFHKIRKTLLVLEREETFLERFGLPNLEYDRFIFTNYDIPTCQIYLYLSKKGQTKYSRIEEGYSTYTNENDFTILDKIMTVICALKGIPKLRDVTREIYLYEPTLMQVHCPYEKKKLPKYSKDSKEDKELLNRVFGYDNEADEFEKYKIIIFEESFVQDKMDPINDYEVFNEMIEAIGPENFILKTHPRNDILRFTNIAVNKSRMPWEIIQINGNFEDKIFLTVSSAAALASKLWFDDRVKTIFLYDCVNRHPHMVDKNYLNYFKTINEMKHPEDWIVPQSVEEAIREMENL
ncbi:MAG: hypothetical protein PUB19_08715 [Lachnospiraceae bacterium]|nr:hypothetical protein [Lachnospiraceae bacterium]